MSGRHSFFLKEKRIKKELLRKAGALLIFSAYATKWLDKQNGVLRQKFF
jgi:hypothetical protein